MNNPGKIIKDLRNKRGLSQRDFAKLVHMSYRQIQRLEMQESDITLKKFENILRIFGLDLKIAALEPDWEALANFGLPISIRKRRRYTYKSVKRNIIMAAYFLKEYRPNNKYYRSYDAFKSLLLALKTHYPTKFYEIENKTGRDMLDAYELNKIQGRDIKLRNICLSNLSSYFNLQKKVETV